MSIMRLGILSGSELGGWHEEWELVHCCNWRLTHSTLASEHVLRGTERPSGRSGRVSWSHGVSIRVSLGPVNISEPCCAATVAPI